MVPGSTRASSFGGEHLADAGTPTKYELMVSASIAPRMSPDPNTCVFGGMKASALSTMGRSRLGEDLCPGRRFVGRGSLAYDSARAFFGSVLKDHVVGNNGQIVDQCRLCLSRCNVGRSHVARAASQAQGMITQIGKADPPCDLATG